MKYKLTLQTKECYGHTLHRIECVESFANVKVGDLGGWIESKDNLSDLGNAWVYGDAKVYGNAKVYGDAKVYGNGDYIVIKNSWSSCRYFTYTASNNKWCVGCFYGTGEELIAKAYEDSELSGKCYEATVRYIDEIERIKSDVKKIKK